MISLKLGINDRDVTRGYLKFTFGIFRTTGFYLVLTIHRH
jgi:hypothetical protein